MGQTTLRKMKMPFFVFFESARVFASKNTKTTQKMLDKTVQSILEAWKIDPNPNKPTQINKFKISFQEFQKCFENLFGSYHLIDPSRLNEYIYLHKQIREEPVVIVSHGSQPVQLSMRASTFAFFFYSKLRFCASTGST